jgi:hypothetical protein
MLQVGERGGGEEKGFISGGGGIDDPESSDTFLETSKTCYIISTYSIINSKTYLIK